MQRLIKFRAWDKYLKRYARLGEKYEDDVLLKMDGSIHLWCCDEGGCDLVRENDPRFDIQQYTGLKDKNGKEIYEGDIVIFALPNNQWSDGQEVKFHRGSFVTKSGGVFSLGFMANSKNLELLEVIGNIHENKELLDGTAK